MTPDDLRRVADALALAARAHAGQSRKGHPGQPQIVHIADVAVRVLRSTDADAETMIAALLHDAVEDTDVTLDQIGESFGQTIAGIVAELTDDPTLPEAERRRRQVEEAPGKSGAARRIKLADKASNLAALATADPSAVAEDERQTYLAWALDMLAALRGTDAVLEADLAAEAERLRLALGLAPGEGAE